MNLKKMNRGKVEVRKVTLTEIEDDIEPPPPDLKTDFKSVQEWLFAVCDGGKPDKSIKFFNLGLFESSDGNTLYLAGINKYEDGHTTHTLIEFEPSNMYCSLSQDWYGGLSREQLLIRLTDELKAFTQSEKFLNSFLASADAIVFKSNGQIVWKR